MVYTQQAEISDPIRRIWRVYLMFVCYLIGIVESENSIYIKNDSKQCNRHYL